MTNLIKSKVYLLFLLLIIINITGKTEENFFEKKAKETQLANSVDTGAEAEIVFNKMRSYTYYYLGMNLRYPYRIVLVTPAQLDTMITGIYKGVEIGLYFFKGGIHYIYLLNNLSPDEFMGTSAHEYAHAWQKENCPPQSLELKEGFADWVAYKVLNLSGAYTTSQGIFYRSDPVYGKGFKLLSDIEQKQGINGVIEFVKTHQNF